MLNAHLVEMIIVLKIPQKKAYLLSKLAENGSEASKV